MGTLKSKLRARVYRSISALAAMLGSVATAAPAFAQGCSMCYSTAAAARANAIQALRSGILVLLIPPLLIFVGIFWITWRSRERFANEDDSALDREFDEWLARAPLENGGKSPERNSAGPAPPHHADVPSALSGQTRGAAPKPTFWK